MGKLWPLNYCPSFLKYFACFLYADSHSHWRGILGNVKYLVFRYKYIYRPLMLCSKISWWSLRQSDKTRRIKRFYNYNFAVLLPLKKRFKKPPCGCCFLVVIQYSLEFKTSFSQGSVDEQMTEQTWFSFSPRHCHLVPLSVKDFRVTDFPPRYLLLWGEFQFGG